MRSSRPRRFNPAAANTRAPYWPSSSFRILVWTFPRTGANSASGNSSRSWSTLRLLAHPMGLEKSGSLAPSGKIRTSLGSSRLENASRGSSSGTSMGISFKLWTDRSLRPSSRALSSSLTNSPFPPTWSKVLSKILSPVVFMVRRDTSMSGQCSLIKFMTISDWITARRLSLLPITSLFFIHLLQSFHALPQGLTAYLIPQSKHHLVDRFGHRCIDIRNQFFFFLCLQGKLPEHLCQT